MRHPWDAVLLLLTLPVTLAFPKASSIQSREAEPMFYKGEASASDLSAEASTAEVATAEAATAEAAPGELFDEIVYTMEARKGRDKQRFTSTGERLLAGVVALNEKGDKVMLVKMLRYNKPYQLPKGGWDSDETMKHAAQREGWEEAGLQTVVEKELGFVKRKGRSENTEAHFLQVRVSKKSSQWPDMANFARDWFTYQQAKAQFDEGKRWDMLEILDRSDIIRNN